MIKVLLVDDDDVIRTALSHALELQYFKVTSLADGSKVVKEISDAKYDVVVLDIVMPNKEGLETIEDIRKVDRNIPILAVSGGGKTMPDMNLTIAKMMGATDTLAKPFDSITLIHKIQNILRN